MKIENLIELLKNRLNSFKVSKDYALINGDLGKVNETEIEISNILDTLYKLNLLIDASKTAIEKEINLSDLIIPGSVSIVNGYDLSSYSKDPLYVKKIAEILSYMTKINNATDIDHYINKKSENSPISGKMILSAANTYAVDVRLMIALIEFGSHFGTISTTVETFNPGNIENNDTENIKTYKSWQKGVNAIAEWLNNHRKMESPVPILEPEEIIPIITDPILLEDNITEDIITIPDKKNIKPRKPSEIINGISVDDDTTINNDINSIKKIPRNPKTGLTDH